MSPHVNIDARSQRVFFGTIALLFTVSSAATIAWCTSMSLMRDMPMPGGWTMSMAWMLMPGQTWCSAAAEFLGMWIVMMVAMMLPSLTPMLWRYRDAVSRSGKTSTSWYTTLAATGYFCVWSLIGLAVFPLGTALAAVAMQLHAVATAVPLLTGAVVVVAGAVQFTAWKARHLACCSALPLCRSLSVDAHAHADVHADADAAAAWRFGLRLGLHCCYCCANLTVILLVIGVMDLRAMVAVTMAITLERLAPAGEKLARAVGIAIVGIGLLLIAEAAGLA